MPSDDHHPMHWFTDEDELVQFVKRKARKFSRRHREDLSQSLALAVWRQVSRYDRRLGSHAAFATSICDYALRTEARRLASTKCRTLDNCASLEDTYFGVPTNETSDIDRIALRLDVESALAELSDEEREICVDLRKGVSKRQVAKKRGLTRYAMQRVVERIKCTFRRWSLDHYWFCGSVGDESIVSSVLIARIC